MHTNVTTTFVSLCRQEVVDPHCSLLKNWMLRENISFRRVMVCSSAKPFGDDVASVVIRKADRSHPSLRGGSGFLSLRWSDASIEAERDIGHGGLILDWTTLFPPTVVDPWT